MAAFSGTAGSVSYASGGDATLVGISEWSLDTSMSPPEATEFGDSWDEYVPSVRNATGSFSGNRSIGATQDLILSKFVAGDLLFVRLHEDASKRWLGTVLFTGVSPSLSVKGKGEISYNFQVVGALTYS